MKIPSLKIKKKVRIAGIKRLKNNIKELIHQGLLDIEPYIVIDVMKYLKKEGIIYVVPKKSKKNRKKIKRRNK